MILYEARGQAKVVYDLILSNNHLLEYLVDDHLPKIFPHNPFIHQPTDELLRNQKVIIAMGDNIFRGLPLLNSWCVGSLGCAGLCGSGRKPCPHY